MMSDVLSPACHHSAREEEAADLQSLATNVASHGRSLGDAEVRGHRGWPCLVRASSGGSQLPKLVGMVDVVPMVDVVGCWMIH